MRVFFHYRAVVLFLAILIAALTGGCRGAPTRPAQAAYVNLEALARLHPAWPERDSLTALIASAHASHQRPIPAFRVPPEPSLPPVTLRPNAAVGAARRRMEQLIEARIQRDFQAVREKMERDVARYRETEQAAAEQQARLDADTRAPAFLRQYQALATQYANRIAPLHLKEVELRPQPNDPLLMSIAERLRRQQRLAAVGDQIVSLLRERDQGLHALQQGYLDDLQADRQRRLAEAEGRVVQFREERLAELRRTAARQQAQIRSDLVRSMRLRVSLPEVQPPLPSANAATARRLAAATSASALATMDQYQAAARDVEHQLFLQREDTERLILAATRAAVIQLGLTHHIDVHFTTAGGPDKTALFAAWLRERWKETT